MNAKSPNTPRSLTDWNKVDAHIIAQQEYDEAPELTDEMLEMAEVSKGETLIRAGMGPLTKALRGRPKSLKDLGLTVKSTRRAPLKADPLPSTGKASRPATE